MKKLKLLNQEVYHEVTGEEPPKYPVKILQFGDGNFIRSFIDWMIYRMNRDTDFQGSIVSVQALPNEQSSSRLNNQEGYFTLLVKGKESDHEINEKYIVNSIEKAIDPYTDWTELLKLAEEEEVEFIFSNTTEAGITYLREEYTQGVTPISYPAKITALLYHRYISFSGDEAKGWIIIPCELIEENGQELKRICLQLTTDWALDKKFMEWLNNACTFCDTLVDRIVPGRPKGDIVAIYNELGYKDELVAIAEPYHLFVIQGPSIVREKLPLHDAGLNVIFDEVNHYRELKVKLLNGAHTILAFTGLLSGMDNVRKSIQDPVISTFINNCLRKEIIAAMSPSAKAEAAEYIEGIYERFDNPFIEHKLLDISLNSYSKFKARVWSSLYENLRTNQTIPKRLTFACASLFYYYKGVCGNVEYEIKDSKEVIDAFNHFYREYNGTRDSLIYFIKEKIQEDFLQGTKEVKLDLLCEEIADGFILIDRFGMKEAIKKIEGREQNEEDCM